MTSQKRNTSLKLVKTLREAHEVFSSVGLHGWRLSFTQHREYYGICFKDTKEVRFSAPWFLVFTPEQRLNVIIHEAAHAIVGTHRQHGPSWAKKCQELGLNNPYDNFMVSPKLTQKAFTWNGECANGCQHYRYRLNPEFDYVCGSCDTNSLIEWKRNPRPNVPDPLTI